MHSLFVVAKRESKSTVALYFNASSRQGTLPMRNKDTAMMALGKRSRILL
jgi:hypothetical protein